jgi:hypothetical protein
MTTCRVEGNSMCNIKKETMSSRLDVKVIFSLQARNMCITLDSTRSHTSKSTFRNGTHCQLRKKPHHVLDSTFRIGIGLDTLFNSNLCDLILLH